MQPTQSMTVFNLEVDYRLCHFCGACVAVCPPDAIFLHNSALVINMHTCTACERCLHACPLGAISQTGISSGSGQ
jgi:ferredoxin